MDSHLSSKPNRQSLLRETRSHTDRPQIEDKHCSCISAPRYVEGWLQHCCSFHLIAEHVRISCCACRNRSCVPQSSNQAQELDLPFALVHPRSIWMQVRTGASHSPQCNLGPGRHDFAGRWRLEMGFATSCIKATSFESQRR